MYNNFTEEAKKVLINAKTEMKKLKHPYIGSEHLLLAILHGKNEISDKLKNYNLNYDKFRNEIINIVGIGKTESECFLYTPLLKRVMENSIYDSKENNNGIVTVNHLFSALLEEGEGVAIRILIGMNIDLDELYHEFSFRILSKKDSHKKLLVNELGVDITKQASLKELDPVIGRDEEIRRVIEILCRRKKNNPILIGEAGVGKTAIVEELSRLIVNNEVPNVLKNKRIISLDMASIVSGTKYRGEFEERVNKIIKELEENDDIIIFIDEIHTIVGAGGAEGAIDASNIFKPALARNKIRCIGATTTNEFKKFIEQDKALERRFQKVVIKEPDNNSVKDILLKLKDTYSKYHKTIINDDIIDYIIELSNKYIHNRYQPDKAIDILDEVCSCVSLNESKDVKKYNKLNGELGIILKEKKGYILKSDYKQASIYKQKENDLMNKINRLELKISKDNKNIVTKEDVIKVVSRKCDIPIFKLNKLSVDDIQKVSKEFKQNIIGHDLQIEELMNIYKKINLGFKDDNMCYSIMFIGPSGIGKTKLAKLFSSKLSNNVIKLDMSEYSEAHSISKLIGSPAGYVGYNDNKNIFEKIKNNPFTVLILDEIDKAHSNIINLLYQILDEGKIKDSKGDEIYFNNCIIIMTSNIGYNVNNIGFNNGDIINRKLKDYFSVPFINRIDSIIRFNHLTEDDLTLIINNKLKDLKNKYKDKSVTVKISNDVIKEIIKLSNFNEFGARKIDKIIKNNIENIIIDGIISNKKIINIKSILKEEIIM